MLKKIKIILKTHRKINFHHYYCRLFRICIKGKARGRKPKFNICKYPDKPIVWAHSHVCVLVDAASTSFCKSFPYHRKPGWDLSLSISITDIYMWDNHAEGD